MLTVHNETRDAILADRAHEATSALERMRGLLGRDRLARGEGLLIEPCNAIHTCFMRFSIDVLFLDAEDRVIRVLHSLPPWRLTRLHARARRVVELPAGTARATGTEAGDRLAMWVATKDPDGIQART